MLGGLAKGVGGIVKKSKKVDPKKFAGKMQQTKEKSGKSKGGALVPSPAGGIIKVVAVKPEKGTEPAPKGESPIEGALAEVWSTTFAIERALAKEAKAKKKKAEKDADKAQKQKRLAKESWLEGAAKGIGNVVGAVASKSGVSSLWGTIVEIMGVIVTGWLIRYLPQILGFVATVVEWIGKIGRGILAIVTPIFHAVAWIATAGTAVVSMLLGTDPEEAQKASLIKNITEIQKKVPLMEAAFAAFAVLSAKGRIKKMRQPPKTKGPKPKRKLTKADRTKAARKRLQAKKARANINKAKRFGSKVKTKIARKAGPATRKILRSSSKVIGGAAKGVGKLGSKLMGGLKMVGKFAKFPVIGPLIIAVTQILAGEPIGKAVFMGLGASLGGALGGALGALASATGIGAVLAPLLLLVGEGVGTFVGELLYEGFMGKGWGAAVDRFKEVIGGIFTGVGNLGKAVWNFIASGGIWKFLGNVFGGIGKVVGWLFSPDGLLGLLGKGAGGLLKLAAWIFSPTGLIWDILKLGGKAVSLLWNFITGGGLWGILKGLGGGALKVLWWLLGSAVPMAAKSIGGIAVAIGKWIAAGFSRFWENFKKEHSIPIAKGGGRQTVAGMLFPFLRDKGSELVTKIPNFFQLLNPFAMWPLLIKSFFPGEGAQGTSPTDAAAAPAAPKDKDATKPESIQPSSDAGASASSAAGGISESASYDKPGAGGKGGIIPIPTKQMQGGGARGGSSLSSLTPLNRYETTESFSKAMMLAKLYKD